MSEIPQTKANTECQEKKEDSCHPIPSGASTWPGGREDPKLI